jgi:GT2 family glycosyltransferase
LKAEQLRSEPSSTIVIPTFERHEVLVETIQRMLRLTPPPDEIVVVDQTASHPSAVQAELAELEARGAIVRLIRAAPSIPGAMNDGLLAASGRVVIFTDDDVVPESGFVAAHLAEHERHERCLVAGQVLQPGEAPRRLTGKEFAFYSTEPQCVREFVGCNFSIPRALMLELGGFDERFPAAAYRYEREVSDRARRSEVELRFAPKAALRHLRATRGGTRAWGDHLRTFRPSHSVGEYYYLLRSRAAPRRWREFLGRPVRAIATRHHLRRPWWIPATLVAETSGMLWALVLAARGPALLDRRKAA